MADIANYIAQNRPNFNRASIDRAHMGNALLRNEVDRLPQTNRAQDLAIQADEQAISQNRTAASELQKQNARGILARGFSAIRQSQQPLIAARQFLASPDFKAAGQLVGLPVDQFTITAQDTDDSIRSISTDYERMLGGEVQAAQDSYRTVPGDDGSLFSENVSTGQRTTLLGRQPQPPTPSSGPQPPSGYRYLPDGTLEPNPGGPADLNSPQNRRRDMAQATQLRKEYEDQPAVKDYRSVLPLYQRAKDAPDNRAGDISVIYALGKMFDPTSVVREGELNMASNASPWWQRVAAGVNSQMTGKGRLNPEMRAEILLALDGQIAALRPAYEQERQRYGSYATGSGMDENSIVGPDPAAAFGQQPQPPMTATGPNGQKIQLVNGQWVPM